MHLKISRFVGLVNDENISFSHPLFKDRINEGKIIINRDISSRKAEDSADETASDDENWDNKATRVKKFKKMSKSKYTFY